MTDPIADMLTRIRNAYMAEHKSVNIPHSRVKTRIAEILKEEGYIEALELSKQGIRKTLKLKLKYQGKIPIIGSIKRISSPGRRIYVRTDKIPSALNGYGITILSTSKGIMTDKNARKEKIGGEIICEVW